MYRVKYTYFQGMKKSKHFCKVVHNLTAKVLEMPLGITQDARPHICKEHWHNITYSK